MIEALVKKAIDLYPTNIDVYDSAIEDEPKYQLMIQHIRQKRIEMPVAAILEKVKTYFPRNTCCDTTYLYNTNPCWRIEITSRKLIVKVLISLLADVYTVKEITREIYKPNKNLVDEVDSGVIQKIEVIFLKILNLYKRNYLNKYRCLRFRAIQKTLATRTFLIAFLRIMNGE